jgi:hypothetical protein
LIFRRVQRARLKEAAEILMVIAFSKGNETIYSLIATFFFRPLDRETAESVYLEGVHTAQRRPHDERKGIILAHCPGIEDHF